MNSKQAHQFVLQVDKISEVQKKMNNLKKGVKALIEETSGDKIKRERMKIALSILETDLRIYKRQYQYLQRGISFIQGKMVLSNGHKFILAEDMITD